MPQQHHPTLSTSPSTKRSCRYADPFLPLILLCGKKISLSSALHGNDSYRETNRASKVASSMLNCYIYAPPTVLERLAYGSPTARVKQIAQMEYLASALEKVIQGSAAKKSA
jgi:hypothetical protein